MDTYIAYFKLAFRQKTVYRVEYLLGILNTCIQIFVLCAIWKALYSGHAVVAGVTYSMITTNFILTQGLSSAFELDDYVIQRRLNDGSIANELLKPIDLIVSLLMQSLGEIAFKLLTNFLPAVVISTLFIGILPPAGLLNFICFLISVLLGFAILWAISTMVQMTAFWIMNVWSVATLKNVLINVLSGALLPVWFMPKFLKGIINYTPFVSIYFTPLKIYLGEMQPGDILISYCQQLGWFCALYILGQFMWQHGKRRIVVQGG